MNLFEVGSQVRIVYVRKGYDSLKRYLNTLATVKSATDDGGTVSYLLLTHDGRFYTGNNQVSIVAA